MAYESQIDGNATSVGSWQRPPGSVYNVPVEEYTDNLVQIVRILKATGAKLIWRSTTPVPQGYVVWSLASVCACWATYTLCTRRGVCVCKRWEKVCGRQPRRAPPRCTPQKQSTHSLVSFFESSVLVRPPINIRWRPALGCSHAMGHLATILFVSFLSFSLSFSLSLSLVFSRPVTFPPLIFSPCPLCGVRTQVSRTSSWRRRAVQCCCRACDGALRGANQRSGHTTHSGDAGSSHEAGRRSFYISWLRCTRQGRGRSYPRGPRRTQRLNNGATYMLGSTFTEKASSLALLMPYRDTYDGSQLDSGRGGAREACTHGQLGRALCVSSINVVVYSNVTELNEVGLLN